MSNVCVTPVGETSRLAPLKKTECINRITHWTRDPTFCGWHACLQVFFEVDGSSFVRVRRKWDYASVRLVGHSNFRYV